MQDYSRYVGQYVLISPPGEYEIIGKVVGLTGMPAYAFITAVEFEQDVQYYNYEFSKLKKQPDTDIYLTPERRQYYLNALKQVAALPETSPSGHRLDAGVLSYLNQINFNQNLVTIYSKKLQPQNIGTSIEAESWIDIAFFKDYELQFREALRSLELTVNFWVQSVVPSIKNDHTAITDNPEYFRIVCFKIKFKNPDFEQHENFWKLLASRLSALR